MHARRMGGVGQTRASGLPRVQRGLTFWLFLPSYTLVVVMTASHMLGLVSTWSQLGTLVPAYYFLAMCVHDAIHRAAHTNARLNNLVGWVCATALGLTYPVIRRTHLEHHRATEHDHDVESFVYKSGWTLLPRLLISNWRCYAVLPELKRREKLQAIVFVAVIVVALATWPQQLFWSWLVPMQLGIALFVLMTVYLPHGRFAKWVMENVPAVTGHHEAHHRHPQYPWYQYFTMGERGT